MQIRNRTFFISENVSDYYRKKFAKDISLRCGKLTVSPDDRADYVIYDAQKTDGPEKDRSHSCVKITVNEMVSFLDSAPQPENGGFCIIGGELVKWVPEEFEGHTLRISSGVTGIRKDAFKPVYACQKAVFRKTIRQVKRIIFPKTLRYIEQDAFAGFKELESIRLQEGIQEITGFRGCRSLDNVSFPKSCTKIGDYAFASCTSFAHAEWPENVIEIGENAFSGTGFREFVSWEKLEKIGAHAFEKCRWLKEVNLSGRTIVCGRGAFRESGTEKLIINAESCILSKGCFASCPQLEEFDPEKGDLKICPDTFPPSLLSKALFELHRGTCTEKAGRMWRDMIRSSGLKFIEQLPPDLYAGYGAFCAEIAGIKDYKADIRKAAEKEAMDRLKWLVKHLGLNPNVRRYFKQGRLYYSYLTAGGFMGSVDTISYDPRYEQIVRQTEKQFGILVYHVIESYSYGPELVMLCIEHDWRDWEISRPDSSWMMAYVYNMELGEGEFGDVKLASYQGALCRIG